MTTTRRTATWALAALATLAVQACATDATGPSAAPDGVRPAAYTGLYTGQYPTPAASAYQLQKNRQKWAATGIDDYSYDIRNTCYCFMPTYRVEVIDGEVVSVFNLNEPVSDSGPAYGGPADTVPGLFDRIQAELDAAPDGLRATYAELGYPTSLTVDPESNTIDDEYGWVVENFQVIQ
jgi:hypothetical protein